MHFITGRGSFRHILRRYRYPCGGHLTAQRTSLYPLQNYQGSSAGAAVAASTRMEAISAPSHLHFVQEGNLATLA